MKEPKTVASSLEKKYTDLNDEKQRLQTNL